MNNLIKMELKKAICSKFFLLGCSLLLIFALYSTVYMLENRVIYNPETINEFILQEDGTYKTNPDLPLFGFYNSWVGGEELSLGTTLFYNLMPVGAAIPFAWSYHTERKSGYLKNIASRTDKKKYFIAKTIAVFISGILAVLIPLIVNIALVSAFVPTIDPFAGYTFYNHVYIGDMWIEMYYTYPWVYVTLYVLLDAIYGGIYALLSFATAFYIKNIFAVLFLPFVSLLGIGYLKSILVTNISLKRWFEFNPTVYLHSLHHGYQRVWWIIMLITLCLFVFALCTIFIRGFRDEIF